MDFFDINDNDVYIFNLNKNGNIIIIEQHKYNYLEIEDIKIFGSGAKNSLLKGGPQKGGAKKKTKAQDDAESAQLRADRVQKAAEAAQKAADDEHLRAQKKKEEADKEAELLLEKQKIAAAAAAEKEHQQMLLAEKMRQEKETKLAIIRQKTIEDEHTQEIKTHEAAHLDLLKQKTDLELAHSKLEEKHTDAIKLHEMAQKSHEMANKQHKLISHPGQPVTPEVNKKQVETYNNVYKAKLKVDKHAAKVQEIKNKLDESGSKINSINAQIKTSKKNLERKKSEHKHLKIMNGQGTVQLNGQLSTQQSGPKKTADVNSISNLHKHKEKLRKKNIILKNQENELNNNEQKLNKKSHKLNERERKLQEHSANLQSQGEALEAHEEKLKKHGHKLRHLANQDATNEANNKEMAKHETNMKNHKKKKAHHKRALAKHKKALAEHKKEMTKQKKALAAHNKKKNKHKREKRSHNLAHLAVNTTLETKNSAANTIKITPSSGQPGGINNEQLEKEKLAHEFEEIYNKETAYKKQKAAKAQKLWKTINKHSNEDDKTADFADKIGLPPPPSRYTKEQIAIVKKHMNYKPQNLSFDDKVHCMTLLNSAKSLSDLSEQAGRDSHLLPHKVNESKTHSLNYDKIMKEFNMKCL